ncbi:signal peptidase I [Actinotignum schaalii]|uniref:signal peptidase I n=1 Tax=Actinotignum schaalii TaxID=59505 RepID=UPI00041BB20C|nr:signal peptidase I [Actinotignum schaalii]WQN45688.1 signal peptidase I [Actinotignum schaalii]
MHEVPAFLEPSAVPDVDELPDLDELFDAEELPASEATPDAAPIAPATVPVAFTGAPVAPAAAVSASPSATGRASAPPATPAPAPEPAPCSPAPPESNGAKNVSEGPAKINSAEARLRLTLTEQLSNADEGLYAEALRDDLARAEAHVNHGGVTMNTTDGQSSAANMEQPPSYPPEVAPVRPDAETREAPVRNSRLRSVVEMALTVAVVLLVSVIIKTFFIQAFNVPSGSMETTLSTGDKFFVNRMVTDNEDLRRGDIVVFVDPGGWLDDVEENRSWIAQTGTRILQGIGLLPADSGHYLVKRIIAKGGDTVSCCGEDGRLQVNGVPITEEYLNYGVSPSLQKFEVKVPEGYLWMMGDNRANSKDSRWHQRESGNGFVPVDNVVGRAWYVFAPWSRHGRLPDMSHVFAGVPEPAAPARVLVPIPEDSVDPRSLYAATVAQPGLPLAAFSGQGR